MKVHVLNESNVVINTVVASSVDEVINGFDGTTGGIGWTVVDGVIQNLNPEVIPYDIKRKGEYPPMVDYLDGIVKNNQTQIDKYISDCQAVKDKYPKP